MAFEGGEVYVRLYYHFENGVISTMHEIYRRLACFGMCLHVQNSLSGFLHNLF